MGSYFSALRARTRRVAFEIAYDPQDPDAAIQSVIERRGLDNFQWRVWWVAASGFFTTSYSIFAVNVISPMLAYVYPEPDCSANWPGSSLIINLVTLIGTIFGAIVFGFLADRHGRKSVYGLELAIVIVATIGITTASTGAHNSMKVYGWILFWRILLGIGLGAEYPLSSIIAAEWSSTKSRGRMMAAVFLMQSVGQLAAYGFGLAILVGVSNNLGLSPEERDPEIAVPKVDAIWRAIIGVGAFPALVSLVLRRTIPETPYYLVETGRVTDAVTAAREVYAPQVTLQPTGHDALSPMQTMSNEPAENFKNCKGSWWANTVEYVREARTYLSHNSRWRILLGVMLTWWLLDLAYYGLGLDNPKTISAIWRWDTPDPSSNASFVCGRDQGTEIYKMLHGNIVKNIATISSGTLPGSIIILLAIDYVPRVTWMAWTFVALAVLFAINGGTFFIAFESDKHGLTIVLYVLAQVVFNLGPNTMTFILPAELFATKFRGTFYGLAAASGKLGAITILLIINFGVYEGKAFLPSGSAFAKTLLGFTPAMLLGGFITWVWIPEVQFPRGYKNETTRDENASDDGLDHGTQESEFGQKLKLPNRPLAHIAQDPEGGQVLGIRQNLRRLIQRVRGSRRRDSTVSMLESGADGVPSMVSPSGAQYLMHPQPFSALEIDLDSGDLGTRS
ncbi:major facilitator superfamily domain-containing protein [Xylaria grammica]|nr:major facilitator superfamily domain-containing protein [Xylaria grammica]